MILFGIRKNCAIEIPRVAFFGDKMLKNHVHLTYFCILAIPRMVRYTKMEAKIEGDDGDKSQAVLELSAGNYKEKL